MKDENMSQFNPDELASYVKQETHSANREYSKSGSFKKIPTDTLITHRGGILGALSTLSEDTRCDCPEGHLHSDGQGCDYAHTVQLSGGEIGISCSGDSCSKLFIPDTELAYEKVKSKTMSLSLDIGQLDSKLLHFTEDMIPEPIRRWTRDNCMQAEGSLNYGAVAAIIVFSNLIGCRCQVRPKEESDWKVTPNLWGMVIGNPSERKSPVVEQFMKPLRWLESKAIENHKAKKLQYEDEKIKHDIAAKVKKKALEKAYVSGDEKAIATADRIPVPQLEEPKMERLIMNDATTEKIGEIMSNNTRTLLLYRDELSGFLASLQKHGREGDRSFYLESFNGDSSYTWDRIGRGTIHIDTLSIGVFGTIQPSVLAKYLLPGEGSGDGLIQRMQLSVFSDGEYYPYYDGAVDRDAKATARKIVEKLAYQSFELMPGSHNDPDSPIPYFCFDTQAQALFIEWYNDLKSRVIKESDENIQAHLGKYYSLLPSLALTFFLIEKAAEVTSSHAIGVCHTQLAIEWCRILESHARKMYSLTDVSKEMSLKEKIINYVRKHQSELPKTCGELSGNIRGAKAEDVGEVLKDIAEIVDRKVLRLY